jgi:hypothetical protein
MSDSKNLPSRTLLEETPQRALTFLRGIGVNPELASIMEANGYSEKVHDEGWALMFKASGYSPGGGMFGNPTSEAIRQLADWNGVGFHRMHAALAHLHPEQEAFVFHDVEPKTGVEAVISTGMILDRLDVLEKATDRAETRDADKKALDTLAERGIDGKERTRLRALVNVAKSTAKKPLVATDVDARTAALVELRNWYADWAETAHAVITRRGDLIKLGLAKRQKRSEPDAKTSPTPASPTATNGSDGATPIMPIAPV